MYLNRISHIIFLALAASLLLITSCQTEPTVDFSTQIKPILNKKCIACHGGVKKSGGLSFLFEDEMYATTQSGATAIIKGNAKASEVYKRIIHQDPELRMPLEGDQLTQDEIDLIATWIDEGANWGEHWAYIPPVDITPPNVEVLQSSANGSAKNWINNDIDKFVLNQLSQVDLQPNEQANCATLIRRLSLDLIGLPPDHKLVDQFCADPTEETYQSIVDRLLASPKFGEKWASWWLDLARYADSKGYERDPHRNIWRYRDWVVDAFNEDMPFDQFTIEQLAGDLLPEPTPSQYVATAFNRNTMSNDEGGSDNEEFRVAAVVDRVSTVWSVWQSTTMNCVQCHSHPYDPIRHKDFYTSYALFNNTRDADVFTESPNYRFYQPADSTDLETVKTFIKEKVAEQKQKQLLDFLHFQEPKIHVHDFDTLVGIGRFADNDNGMSPDAYALRKGIDLSEKNALLLFHKPKTTKHNGVFDIRINSPEGRSIGQFEVKELSKNERKKNPHALDYSIIPIKKTNGVHDIYFVFSQTDHPEAHFRFNWMSFFELPRDTAIQPIYKKLITRRNVDQLPIMVENTQPDFFRISRMFDRGNWLTQTDTVTPDVPNIFKEHTTRNEINNRLDFGHWLVDPNNPLTSRVIVNRVWEQLFGYGIVETIEDFGTQSATPSHPALLDWLAVQMIDQHHWKIKSLLKEIVSSAAYRQSSVADAQKLEIDPVNRLLSRGPRFRMTAEQIRDQALYLSDLLSDKMGGPSVMPPQPDGVWSVVYSNKKWENAQDEDRHRRALYTYWRRSSPYPSFMTFDNPDRTICSNRRIRTNTPLQALVTLNDPVYLEAALNLAIRLNKEKDVSTSIKKGYKHLTYQSPTQKEVQILTGLYQEHLNYFVNQPGESLALVDKYKVKTMGDDVSLFDADSLAAMTMVANAIFNLDVMLTKE